MNLLHAFKPESSLAEFTPLATKLLSPVFPVTGGVTGLMQEMVNCYLVGEPGANDRQWMLVDAALPWSNADITQCAARLFANGARPAAIVLTHGHFDHIGRVAELADRWEAPIYAHEMELPYLTGRSSYPAPDPTVGGGGMSFASRFLPRGPVNLGSRLRALPGDGSIPGMPDWTWVATPGHSPGHVSLFREHDRTLIAGDAFVTQKQESIFGILTRRLELRRPPAYFTPDWESARLSVERLAALAPRVAATGHGFPMAGSTLRDGLRRLVTDWERIALPNYGRYVQRPAITDGDGVVWTPPPVWDWSLAVASGIGAAALAVLLLGRHEGKPADRASHQT